MDSIDGMLVADRLSGKFVDFIIDILSKYPDEWEILTGAQQGMFENNRPLLKHKSGVELHIYYGEKTKNIMEDGEWEASLVKPTYLPLTESERKRLGAACLTATKRLILKALDCNRLADFPIVDNK